MKRISAGGQPGRVGRASRVWPAGLPCLRKAVLLAAGLAGLPGTVALQAGRKLTPARATLTLEGTLLHAAGQEPMLVTPDERYRLTAATEYVLATLQDSRLSHRRLRVEGEISSPGIFEVRKLYTVHNGQLYMVRYFCEVCNITALKPGICACCQGPVELQEIPATRAHSWR